MLRKRLQIRLLGSLLAAATIAGFTPAGASAGSYVVTSCNNSPTLATGGWGYEATDGSVSGLPYFYSSQNCAAFGFYRRFENGTVPAGAMSTWTFTAPDGTWISSAALRQAIALRSSGAYDAIVGVLSDGSRRNVATYISGAQGDASYNFPQTGAHATSFRAELGCQSGSNCSGLWNGYYGNEWYLNGATITLVDPSTPAFSDVSGDGWNAAPKDGVTPVSFSASDTGAGVSKVHFLVDGIEHGAKSESCTGGAYVPCPLSSNGQFMLDTTALSEGTHTLAVTVEDFAGNVSRATDKQLSIMVRRPPASSSTTPVTTTNPSWSGGGSPAVGDHLGGNLGSWSGDGNTYTYQWNRCDAQGLGCAPIGGATDVSYTPTTADIGHTLQFCVTATNSGGSATSCSAPTPVVIASHPAPVTDPSHGATPATPGGTPTTVAQPVTSGSSTSNVDRGAPNGTPASDRVVLTAIANSRSSSVKTKYGKRVTITGRLVGPNGAPIAHALLAVQTQTAVPGASMADSAQIITGTDGRFKYLTPVGPSRTIRFGYRAYTADTSFADTTDVHLVVSAGVTIKATPKKVRNKHATVFTGRLLGRPIAKRGVVIDLQVFFRRQWRTFAAPRTNRAGAYKFKYRFMAGAATWKFRARVRRESSYPYALGYSAKQVKVKVVG